MDHLGGSRPQQPAVCRGAMFGSDAPQMESSGHRGWDFRLSALDAPTPPSRRHAGATVPPLLPAPSPIFHLSPLLRAWMPSLKSAPWALWSSGCQVSPGLADRVGGERRSRHLPKAALSFPTDILPHLRRVWQRLDSFQGPPPVG